jgi:DNA repair exonuclease SbcCD ATPase subunit
MSRPLTEEARGTIMQHHDPQAQEEERLRARIDALRAEIAAATAEYEEIKVTLSAFEARYDARIGVLIVELDRLNLQIAEYERRIAALSEPVEEWTRIEEEIRESFREERERIDRETEEATDASRRAAELPPDPPDDTKVALRTLYRKLARDYHPDVAKTADERELNEAAMRRINAAYEANDFDALQRLELELPAKDTTFPGATASARIAWAAAQIGRLERVLAQLTGELAQVRASALFRLWERVNAEPTLLDRLEEDYRREIAERRTVLGGLIGEYRAEVAEQLSGSQGRP